MSEFAIPEAVVSRRLDDETVLVHLETGQIFTLNQTGSRFWELLQEGVAREVIEERIHKEFVVEQPEIQREVEKLIRELLAAELLVQTHA